MKEFTCCFFGHRKIDATDELKTRLYEEIENLLIDEKIDTFLFGSNSEFNDLCYEIVRELKKEYTYIKRIFVRAEFPYISDDFKDYLLEQYEDTYIPEHIKNAGRASYVERNYEMIDKSKFCIVYFDENYLPKRRKMSRRAVFDYQPKSGTKVAYDYAVKKKKVIINLVK